MLESPVLPRAPPGYASSSLPPPTYSIKEAHKLMSPSSARLSPSFWRSGDPSRGNGKPSVPAAIDPCRPAPPPPRPSIRVKDHGSGRVPAVDSRPSPLRPSTRVDVPRSDRVSRHPAPPPRPIDDTGLARLPLRAIDPLRLEHRPRPSTPVDDPLSGRSRTIDSRPSKPGPRPSIRVFDSGSGHSRPAPPPRPIDNPGSGPLPLPANNSPSPAPRPRPSIHVHDHGSGRVQDINSLRPVSQPRPSVHVHDPRSGRIRDINSLRSAPRPRLSIRVDGPGSGRVRAANSRRPAARPRPLIQVDSRGVLGSCKPCAVPNKELEEAESELQRLNELQLGEDMSYEEYSGYLNQLPDNAHVDTSTTLDAVQLNELNARHALYRIKYQLSQQGHDSRLEEEWSFHPDYCKLAVLEDYQRLVPRNYGGYEYAGWDEYSKDFHSYETEQEYIKYCEDLAKKLKWMEAYVPNKYPSLKWGRMLTRGTYQAIKIATDFSKITGVLAFRGFKECIDSMIFDVCFYNEFDGVYYEIWLRYTNETNFRDVLDEVYELNRFPLRQDRMRCALENETFCSDLEEEFLACTTCLKEFIEDKAQVTEVKARELIAEALRNEMKKPKFYEDYCRKKIDIARAIGLISS